jgi:O-antigen ligase
MILNISKILIFCSVFLINFKFIQIPTTQILIIFIGISLMMFHRNLVAIGFYSKHRIKKLLIVIFIFSILTYIFKSGNSDNIKRIYLFNTGFSPDYLYLKMITNGIYAIILALFAFSLGLAFKGDIKPISKIVNFLINLITINAILNISYWIFQTGGVIGRYNFEPAVIGSFGTNIQWSILGFLLQLGQIKKINFFSLNFYKLLILFVSILIIVSRLNQLFFVISLLLYFYLKTKKLANVKVIFFSLLMLIILFISLPFFNTNILSSYEDLTNIQGDDFQVRFSIITSALDIFSEHLLIGIGYGMFAGYNTVASMVQRTESYLGSAHNGVISLLVEFGILGFIIHMILIKQIINGLIASIKFRLNERIIVFSIPIFVFILLNIILSLSSNYFLFPPPSEYSYTGLSIVSWFLIGIIFSFNKKINI